MKSVLFSKKSTPDPELLALKAELAEAQSELAQAYLRFDQAVDPELVESCVYQISAVKARCNYLIRAIKSRSPEALTAAALGRASAGHQRNGSSGRKTSSGISGSSLTGEPRGYEACADEEDALWT